ncbi:alpha/beta fold hydrolase [Hydrogenophaga sp.]
MKRIDIDGVGLEVAHIPGPSERAPLVFLHEGLGSVAMWEQRGRHWPTEVCKATGRAGWLYSRRGYGLSDPVVDVRGPARWQGEWHVGRHEPDYMHHEAWRVLPRLLDALDVSSPVLIGHSDGATIALLHACSHPVAGCVAMAPHVMVETISIQAIERAKALYEADPNGLRQRLSRYHADVDNAFWQWNDVWLSNAFKAFDIRNECASISAPLLLVQGLDDEYGTLAQLDAISSKALHARRVELHDCGHSPQRDQPELLTRAVTDFLRHAP